MYINPDIVIKSGLIVLKEAGKNNDYKILGYKLISDGYSAKRDYEKSLEYVMKASQLLSYSNDQLLKINGINLKILKNMKLLKNIFLIIKKRD